MTSGIRSVHETTLVSGARRISVRIEAARIATAPLAVAECVLCVTDESERIALEEERRSFDARVAEITRIESLGTLAGAIAHDLNNILGIVLAHADLVLLNQSQEEDETLDSVSHIRDAALRAADLSKQMLAYCGRERLRSERLDVSAVVHAMREQLGEARPEGAELVLELGEDLPFVIGDTLRLQQIVLNLVVNAAEAIGPDGGRIVVRTSAAGAGVVIECTDDGRGMDAQTARRAFDPFFTTKRMGRGLGLAVVHGTVRAHGGTVVIESVVGKGTTLRVNLPVALPPVVATTTSSAN